jgi:hypothetical protein
MMKVDGWERSGKKKRLPIYGLQRTYVKQVKPDFEDF